MKKALILASVASMIDLFNMDNIRILQNLGYEVHVACNFGEGNVTSTERVEEFKNELIKKKVKYFDIPIPRSISRVTDIFQSRKMVVDLLDVNNYSILHCHTPIGSVVARSAAKKHRKCGLKVIYTAHGFHFFKGASLINWLTFYPIEKWYSGVTDKLITINHEDFILAQKKFSAKELFYVPGIGVDIKKIKKKNKDISILKEELSLNENDFTLISVGQLSNRKNHKVIIQAMAKLKNPNIKYLIIGEGELKLQLSKMVNAFGLQDNVKILGYKKNVSDFLHVSNCFAFPSKQEGLPVSLMEAMAIPLPVIGSEIRGNTDLIDDGKGGYLSKFDDVDTFAKHIDLLFQNKNLRQKFSLYNLKKVQNFSLESISENMEKIYKL